jgi:hypothetical protein
MPGVHSVPEFLDRLPEALKSLWASF